MKILRLRKNHEERINFISRMPDPFQDKIADSMKRWIPVLREVLVDDQRHRITGVYTITKSEKDAQAKLDAKNLKIVSSYLDRYGWPTRFDAGFIGKSAVEACIQHAPLQVQEKYFPLLIKTFQRDSLSFEAVALLEDRINVRNNRYQVYGTQAIMFKGKKTLFPVENIDSVDAYRARLGFPFPFKNYLKILNIDWNIDAYKKMLPQMVEHYKVKDSAYSYLKIKSRQK